MPGSMTVLRRLTASRSLSLHKAPTADVKASFKSEARCRSSSKSRYVLMIFRKPFLSNSHAIDRRTPPNRLLISAFPLRIRARSPLTQAKTGKFDTADLHARNARMAAGKSSRRNCASRFASRRSAVITLARCARTAIMRCRRRLFASTVATF